MTMVSIGEFARQSRLSPKALRLYDELGLLAPAHVDSANGYRYYDVEQLERARAISILRRIGVPLARIKVIVELAPRDAAMAVEEYWASAEAAHADQKALASIFVNRLKGEKSTMHEVTIETMPARTLLCSKRHVENEAAVWTLGKDFVAHFKGHPHAPLWGRTGAPFLIYYGEVNADSDGPVEFCLPIEASDVDKIAKSFPDLTIRSEPGHDEAVVHMGTEEQSLAQWDAAGETLLSWIAEHGRKSSELGVRVSMFTEQPATKDSVVDRDFRFPLR
jgi:DNA-binding transcriptional MerR regulator